ncbi:MAG: ABC transporter permease [Chloroflexi bacterium]|nr:MAG: ABC transporter permease [Chloroflexota bacterium]
MLRRIWTVIQKEFIQTFRDRRTLLIQLSMPIIQLFLLAYAINLNVDHIPTIVADQSHDSASQSYVNALVASGYFDVVAYAPSQTEVTQAIDEGRARAGVVIPPEFAAHVERGDAQALFLVDGSDLVISQSAYNAAAIIAEMHATDVLMEKVARSGLLAKGQSFLPLDALIRILYNPNMEVLWFVIPGMCAMILQMQSVALTAAAVVREREVGTIEQILVTPIRPGELMIGKITPNILIAMINLLTILAMGIFMFGVPFQGSFWLFFWLAFMYVFSGLGLGILISTISKNQNQAQQIIMMVMMLGIVLSGFMFPRDKMNLVLRLAGDLFPLTYFIPIARGIVSKGIGIEFLWEQVVAMLVYSIVIMVFATRAFKQGLD